MWYHKFDSYIQSLGFKRSQFDHYVYKKQVGYHFIYVLLFVDDMFLVGNNMDLIKEVKQQLSSKYLVPTHFILGMEIKGQVKQMDLVKLAGIH